VAPPSDAFRDDDPEITGLVSRARLGEICTDLRRAGKRIVFTNGCFDLVHPGHVLYLAEAAALGDVLVVGLNSDLSTHALKGPNRPVVDERGRAIVLLGLRSVAFVSVFDEPTPLELIRVVRPDILVKGGDYRSEEVVGREVVEAHGGSVRIVPFHPGYSSSFLVRRIREGLAPDAAGQA
jgi:D-beta-D-heptose 7-phosphate kinase/D-beta-D-heptose 1-phosphate adenosyltransferase